MLNPLTMGLEPRGLTSVEGEDKVPPPPPPPPVPFPLFTVFTVLNTSLLFLAGAALLQWNVPVGLDDFTVLVPDAPELTFIAVSGFEDGCEDLRSQWHRLFSYQLVHAGFFHFFMNMLALASYGVILETMLFVASEPRKRTAQCVVASQVGVLAGALGCHYEFPFSELVGCSAGIYGLIGLAWGVLASSQEIGYRERRCLAATVVVQLVIDVLMFTFAYNPQYGYVSHFTGMCGGLAVGLMWSNCRVFKIVGFIAFVGMFVFLLIQYNTQPPSFHVNPTFGQSYNRQSCCLSAFHLTAGTNVTVAELSRRYVCSGDTLVKR